MTKKQLFGFIIALFGISMFLQIIGIGDLLFWPLFFLIAGYFLKRYSRDWLGSVMYIFAAFLIYAGYRLVKGKPIFEPNEKRIDLTKKERHEPSKDEKHPDMRSFFIGELQMMKQPFDLNDLNVSGFIGDIKIDLSKAMIPEGESTIVISGVIGNVDIYVPSDLEVAVSSAVFIGDINLIGSKKSGLSTKVYAASSDFSESKRRVKVSVSLFIGDVDVKYV